MEPSDGDTVAWSLNGRPEAFAELVHRHGQALHAYLARRAGRQSADDLLSEVWLRAFRRRENYDQRVADARPWLYGIARNTLRAHWRRISTSTETGPAGEPSHDPWADTDARMDAVRHRPALAAALRSLREREREVVLLSAWEQLTPGEIAQTLGVAAGTVRWRLHRARSRLRTHLEETSAPELSETVAREA